MAPDQKADRAERLELYKLLVEMADRVSQRRQAANSFYLTINTLLVGGSAYLGSSATIKTTLLVAVAGILACLYWSRSILSYKTLNTAKFHVINDIERDLVIRPFSAEWAFLDPEGDGKKHNDFYTTEKLVPRIFIGVYMVQALSFVHWNVLSERLLLAIWKACS